MADYALYISVCLMVLVANSELFLQLFGLQWWISISLQAKSMSHLYSSKGTIRGGACIVNNSKFGVSLLYVILLRLAFGDIALSLHLHFLTVCTTLQSSFIKGQHILWLQKIQQSVENVPNWFLHTHK